MDSADTLKKLQEVEALCDVKNRRATFKTWVFSETSKCSASKLAEAGFIFTGSKHEPDSVKCFFCNKHLDCWEKDDDPWTEHQKHSPHCSFAKMEKPQNSFTLAEYMDIRNELTESTLKNILTENWLKINSDFDEKVAMLNAMK